MSLRSKIVLILTAVVGVYALTTSEVQRLIFSERFDLLERSAAREDVERVAAALRDEVDRIDQLSLEWSAWDDVYAYMQGERRAAFERSSLAAPRLARQKIDVLFLVAPPDEQDNQAIVWARCIDPDTGDAVALRELSTAWDELPSNHPLLARARWTAGAEEQGRRPVGILLTEHAPLIVSGRAILRSDGAGEPAGALILGRFLGADLDAELSAQTLVDFDVFQADGRHELPPDVKALADELAASTEPLVREASEDLLHAWAQLPDIQNFPELILRANVTRDVSAVGSTALRFGLVSTLAGGLVLLLALMVLLQRIVVAPLSRLTGHALRIGQTEDFRAKLDMERADELGTLAGEFDSMMGKLEQAREQIADSARTAGMSEIATGILHNVGNVLNSVNISASLVSQRVEGMSIGDLRKVVGLLEQHGDDLGHFVESDPMGKHLRPFLTALSVQLGEQQRTIANEVGSLTSGIEHICELIKSQQRFAVQAELVEQLDLAAKLDEALRITDQAHGQDEGLEVERSYEDLGEVELDKHRLLEIAVNLIQNARQAMAEADRRRLTLRLSGSDDEVRIEVTDTGVGIPKENLTRIFGLGFTTKPDGHGYGLHTAANAAREMGGSLTAESDGPGLGTTFVLTLPRRRLAPTGGQ